MATIFTKIIRRELPGQIVWEDDAFAAIMDINPVSAGHLLVIPKREEDSLFSLPTEEYVQLWELVRWLEGPLRRAIGSPRIGIAVEGFSVPHVHIHMVPVYQGGDLDPNRGQKATIEELCILAGRIRNEIEVEAEQDAPSDGDKHPV
jgi:histidine triad (HIT) family protein